MSLGRRIAEVSGQNTVEGNKYGSQPIVSPSHSSEYRNSETEENCQIGHKYVGGLVDVTSVVPMNKCSATAPVDSLTYKRQIKTYFACALTAREPLGNCPIAHMVNPAFSDQISLFLYIYK